MCTVGISVGLALQFITSNMSVFKKNQSILSKIEEPQSTLDFTFQCKIIYQSAVNSLCHIIDHVELFICHDF